MVGSSSGSLFAEASFSVYGETIPPRKLDTPVRAANYDDYDGVYLDACREGGGASLRNHGVAGWIAFQNTDLGSGTDVFEARVAQAEAGGGDHNPSRCARWTAYRQLHRAAYWRLAGLDVG